LVTIAVFGGIRPHWMKNCQKRQYISIKLSLGIVEYSGCTLAYQLKVGCSYPAGSVATRDCCLHFLVSALIRLL